MARCLLTSFLVAVLATPAFAQTTPLEPASVQPTVPAAPPQSKPSSPVIEEIVRGARTEPAAPRPVRRLALRKPRHHWRDVRRFRGPRVLDRPALAGVQLVEPLPPPGEPPHFVVPVPAYPFETLTAAFTTPEPPIVCTAARRPPGLPDPHLYKEAPVICAPDNP